MIMNNFGMALLVSHTIAVICFGIAVGLAERVSAEYGMLWNLWYLVAFPASAISPLLEEVTTPYANKCLGPWGGTVAMTAIFLVLGGVQYYIVGCLVGRLLSAPR